MHRALVLIPTYNERDNVSRLTEAVLAHAPEAEVLVIDDASPDGTGQILDALSTDHPRIHVLHRASKQGLGSAYLAGFQWSLEHGYDLLVCMDADFSHDPADLPRFLEALQTADLVSGSRYLTSGGIRNWPWNRRILSRGAALYARLLTGMPFTDPTGGFNGYRASMLRALPLHLVASEGYSFQIEMKHLAWMEGFSIRELPIEFVERRQGKSKMSAGIVHEALRIVGTLVLRRRFRRKPMRDIHPDAVRPPQ